ncbi:hypothetical protein IQ07DRAFT_88079 [Pyrenochaeta sp. DS3sAY3a]|nr:hypothetical protein IQ07DRAFT_88079 [Pyrenochaeta sp. DS3sAY3a]
MQQRGFVDWSAADQSPCAYFRASLAFSARTKLRHGISDRVRRCSAFRIQSLRWSETSSIWRLGLWPLPYCILIISSYLSIFFSILLYFCGNGYGHEFSDQQAGV